MPANDDNSLDRPLRPIGYSSKLRVPLEPGWRSDRACKQLHRALLDTLRVNEEGTRHGQDPEFLHDFRVAVRRTRAALSQVPEVYPPDLTAHFKQGFAWLGKITGPTRDLDVFLEQLPEHGAELTEISPVALTPLIAFLKQQRTGEQLALVGHLGATRYAELVGDWGEFLDRPTPPGLAAGATNATRLVLELANERIRKTHHKLIRRGRKIDPRSPAAALHSLRIQGKKLRYLLELFVYLYSPADVRPLIGALKQLQNVLGTYNDLAVQREFLNSLSGELEQHGMGSEAPRVVALLIDHLDCRSLEVRQSFAERFAAFDQPAILERFDRLFGT